MPRRDSQVKVTNGDVIRAMLGPMTDEEIVRIMEMHRMLHYLEHQACVNGLKEKRICHDYDNFGTNGCCQCYLKYVQQGDNRGED